jgi:membrane protein
LETDLQKLLNIWRMIYGVWTEAGKRHIGLIAAGVAFFGMFGLFPGIAAVIAVFGLVADPVVVSDQLELMREVIPEGAYGIFEAQIQSLLNARSDTLGWATFVSIMLALWSSRAAVGALISGIDAIEMAPQRGGIRQMFVALLLTASLVLLATVALMTVVVVPVILAFVPLQFYTVWILEGLRWLIALAVLFLGLSILYRFGPNMKPDRRPWITLGAAIVVVVWIVASAGLSYYLTNFASYNEVYGSIGAVIGLLLWLYITAYLILWGAVINAKLYYIDTPINKGSGPPEKLLS